MKGELLVELLTRGHMEDALIFTRTKHRADRLAKLLNRKGISAERIHGNRSQSQRTRALAAFKAGDFRVLVAPPVPEDYIHRVGRTARAEATGDAFTLVAPEDEADIKRIERAVGAKIPRVRLEDFPYGSAPEAPLEQPRQQRIAAIRAKKAADRQRAAAKVAKKAATQTTTQTTTQTAAEAGRPRRRRYGRRPS